MAPELIVMYGDLDSPTILMVALRDERPNLPTNFRIIQAKGQIKKARKPIFS